MRRRAGAAAPRRPPLFSVGVGPAAGRKGVAHEGAPRTKIAASPGRIERRHQCGPSPEQLSTRLASTTRYLRRCGRCSTRATGRPVARPRTPQKPWTWRRTKDSRRQSPRSRLPASESVRAWSTRSSRSRNDKRERNTTWKGGARRCQLSEPQRRSARQRGRTERAPRRLPWKQVCKTMDAAPAPRERATSAVPQVVLRATSGHSTSARRRRFGDRQPLDAERWTQTR